MEEYYKAKQEKNDYSNFENDRKIISQEHYFIFE